MHLYLNGMPLASVELEPLMPWNVREEDLSIVTDEIDWLSRTMVPVQEWEERLAAEGDKR